MHDRPSISIPPIFAVFIRWWWPPYVMGSALVVSWPPVVEADLMANLSYYAPNPFCDSVGIPVFAVQWASKAFLPVIHSVTFLSGWHLIAGGGPVRFRKRPHVRIVFAAILFCLLALPFAYELVQNVSSMTPHAITGDCGGRAEPVTRLVSWKPSFNYVMWTVAWVFFISALAVSIVSENQAWEGRTAGQGAARHPADIPVPGGRSATTTKPK